VSLCWFNIAAMQDSVSASLARSHTGLHRLLILALIFLSLVYAIQIATPMRLNTDAIVYLSLATSAADGGGFVYHGTSERYPLGYPAFIYLLIKMGLGHAWAFTALNCIFLGIGVFASYRVLQSSFDTTANETLLICCLTLLSFVVVKHVTELASDVVYFGIASCTLWAMLGANNSNEVRRRIYLTVLAGILTLLSISVRTIGIALIPAFLLMAIGGIGEIRKWVPIIMAKRRAAFGLVLGAGTLLALSAAIVLHTRYFHMAEETYRGRGIVNSFAKAAEFQVNEFGEMFLNAPKAKLPNKLQISVPIVGLICIGLSALGFLRVANKKWIVEIYILAYLLILCGAPWQDTRYLLPVTPLLLAYVYTFVKKQEQRPLLKLAAVVYAVCFVSLGLIGLIYSTRISLAGNSFPDLYGDGKLRSTYKTAFRISSSNETVSLNQDALALLYRYEPRAAAGNPNSK